MSVNPCLPTGADRYLCAQGAANKREAAYETRALPGHVQSAVLNSPWQKQGDGPRQAPGGETTGSEESKSKPATPEGNGTKTPETASDQPGLW